MMLTTELWQHEYPGAGLQRSLHFPCLLQHVSSPQKPWRCECTLSNPRQCANPSQQIGVHQTSGCSLAVKQMLFPKTVSRKVHLHALCQPMDIAVLLRGTTVMIAQTLFTVGIQKENEELTIHYRTEMLSGMLILVSLLAFTALASCCSMTAASTWLVAPFE